MNYPIYKSNPSKLIQGKNSEKKKTPIQLIDHFSNLKN